jgi:4-amino-4-deoxy-L-arabinose transferase-like glycosyltransferase
MTRRSGIEGTRRLLLGLVLFAFAWRVHNLAEQSMWRDEIDAIYFALRDLPATLSMFVDTAQNGALYFLGLRPWLSLMGSGEFTLRYLSLIFGVLSIPLLWQLCRVLTPAVMTRSSDDLASAGSSRWRRVLARALRPANLGNAPLIAAVLLAINPYHLWYSQEGKMYTLIIFLTLLSAWFWLKGIKRGGFGPWFGFLVTVSLAIYTHLLMILLIPLFVVWFAIAWPASRRSRQGFLLALAGLTLPYLPLLVWQWDLLTTNEIRTALDFVPLGEILRTVLYYQSSSFVETRNILYLVPIFALGLAGLYVGYRGLPDEQAGSANGLGWRRRLLLIVAWLVVPVLTIYLLSLRQPVFLPRYVIWITPAAMMLLALGIQSFWNNRGTLSRPLAVTLMLYIVVYWAGIGWQEKTLEIKTDLRGTVQYISENRPPEDLLIIQIPYLHVAYQYYSGDQGLNPFQEGQRRLGWWAPGLAPESELGVEAARSQVDRQMRDLTSGAGDIWVMLSEVELADPGHLMLDWLDTETTLIDQVDFRGAQVRHYRMTSEVTEVGQAN